MFLGYSGTTSLGGKWLFFISLRCDGVLGPHARGAPAASSVPNGPNRVRASLLAAYHSISLVMPLY